MNNTIETYNFCQRLGCDLIIIPDQPCHKYVNGIRGTDPYHLNHIAPSSGSVSPSSGGVPLSSGSVPLSSGSVPLSSGGVSISSGSDAAVVDAGCW